MKLSIIIPVYNEKHTIQEILNRVDRIHLTDVEKEIILIDDHSTDGTRDILERLKEKYVVIFKVKNEGKGSAVKEGFKASTGEMLIIQDADLEYDPKDYEKLLRPILQNDADVVFGSRLLSSEPHRVLYFWHYLGNKFLTTLSNMFTNFNLSDMEVGYKVFSRRAVDLIKNELSSKRFGIEPELAALVAKHNLRIYEVGISYYGRSYKEGKKINWKDGLAAIWWIIKYGLSK